jgi:hypothetical protein
MQINQPSCRLGNSIAVRGAALGGRESFPVCSTDVFSVSPGNDSRPLAGAATS